MNTTYDANLFPIMNDNNDFGYYRNTENISSKFDF